MMSTDATQAPTAPPEVEAAKAPPEAGEESELSGVLPRHGVVDATTHRSIEDFLYYEAELVDNRRYEEWVALFTDDVTYEMPLRVTRESQAIWEISSRANIFKDDKDLLVIRVQRLGTEYAWAEQPPSRTRHYVTNVRARFLEDEGVYRVNSNLMVYRNRGDQPDWDLYSACRWDRLRVVDGDWQICHRRIVLDQSTMSAHNLSTFL